MVISICIFSICLFINELLSLNYLFINPSLQKGKSFYSAKIRTKVIFPDFIK